MSSTEVGPVRVGVTGHRLLADVTMVQRGVRRAVDAIRGAYPGRPLTVISALAEGADRLVAQEVMRTPGARLMAILPFAPDRYARDFGALGSPSRVAFEELLGRAYQVHLVPGELPAEFAYQRAGWHIADHCDVLLAVWDGKPQLGRGGTAEIVSRARGLGKPIVIVAAGNRQPGTNDPTSLGSDQGQVFLEGIPSTG